MAQNKQRNQQEKLSYIDMYYAIPACVLCFLCIAGMAIIGGVMFRIDEWSYGIIVLLMLAFALMTMAIISIVAMYWEVSRHHARNSSVEMKTLKNEMENLQKEVEKLQKEEGDLQQKQSNQPNE